MTDEYCTRETELTSHHGYLTGEMTTAERLLSQIQEVTSLSPVVSKEQCVMGREGHTTDWERLISRSLVRVVIQMGLLMTVQESSSLDTPIKRLDIKHLPTVIVSSNGELISVFRSCM